MNPQTPQRDDDLTRAWAREHLRAEHVDGPAALLEHWCQRLKRRPADVTPDDWIALRVLSGDSASWIANTKQRSGNTLAFQWKQLQRFEDSFLNLPASDKRKWFDQLQKHLQGNPAALLRLNRFERFLDLEGPSSDEVDDLTQLVHWLVTVAVSGPNRRTICMENLTDITGREPLRWRRAALQVMKHPHHSQIAPTLTNYIASMHGELASERRLQTARKKAFSQRYGIRLWKHLGRRILPKLVRVAVVVLGLVLVMVVLATLDLGAKPSESWQLPRPVAVALEHMRLDALQRVRAKAADSPAEEPGVREAARVATWTDVAVHHGVAGLDLLERELKLRQRENEKMLDDSMEKIYQEYMNAFSTWRNEVGDELARVDRQSTKESP